jgi:hypothetical protein
MATLDDKSAVTPELDGPIVSPGTALERRRHAQEVLAAQRQRLDRLENELPDEVQRLAEQIAQELAQSHIAKHAELHAGDMSHSAAEAELQLEQLRKQLAARQGELDRVLAELEHARLEAVRFEQELRVCQSLLQTTQSQSDQRRIEFAALHEQLVEAQAQLNVARERQEQMRRELAEEHERLVVQGETAKAERRRMARELKEQRNRRLAETEKREADLQAVAVSGDAQLAAQLTAARLEVAQARSRLSDLSHALEQRSEELAQERRKGEALKDQAAKLREAVKKIQAERGGEKEEVARAAELASQQQEEMKKLRGQCDSLTAKLAATEARLSESAKSDNDSRKKDDLQRRFEMAVEELREVKHVNAELEAKLARRSDAPTAAPKGGTGGLDWEAQKQRLLASLEADDRDDEEAVAERHTIEGTIRITDQIVAEKDQEIADLKRQLAAATAASTPTTGDVELAEAFDRDELIRQERERLQQVRAEWREKIGQAEISISVERATIARERADLEEKMRVFQRQQQTRGPDDPPTQSGKPPRSRWLARLGLKELDEGAGPESGG